MHHHSNNRGLKKWHHFGRRPAALAPARRVPYHFRVREGRGTEPRTREKIGDPETPQARQPPGAHGIADPACPSQPGRTIGAAAPAPAAAGDGKVRCATVFLEYVLMIGDSHRTRHA